MVGRLIEQQDMRYITSELCKDNAGTLPITQFLHFLHLHLARNSESSQILALFFPRIAGVHRFEEFERSLFQIQNVNKVLREATHFQMAMRTNVTQGGY
jgi:hypothetical protein